MDRSALKWPTSTAIAIAGDSSNTTKPITSCLSTPSSLPHIGSARLVTCKVGINEVVMHTTSIMPITCAQCGRECTYSVFYRQVRRWQAGFWVYGPEMEPTCSNCSSMAAPKNDYEGVIMPLESSAWLLQLVQANQRLKDAIRKHRDARGHDRCWENDQELYALLGEGVPTSPELPPREEFMEGCSRYYADQSRRRLPVRYRHEGEP